MSEMSQLETFRATVSHEQHDSYLYHASFTPDLDRRIREAHGLDDDADLGEYFGMFRERGVAMTPPDHQDKPDFSRYYDDIEMTEDCVISESGVMVVKGDFYHFTRRISPLRNASSLEDIESFPIPPLDGYSEASMADEVEKAHAAGRVACGWAGHMYENAWQIRGYEQFLEDMLLRPEWCESILDRLMHRNKQMACAAARAGVDVIHTGDDVANQNALMFSPSQWRRFLKSRWNEIYQAARNIKPDVQIWYHSDGNIRDIIPELIEIGVTMLNPVQPECLDPVEVKERWGDRLTLDGTIGTQSTMPWGTPDEVRRVTRHRIETLGRDGALILAPTHTLEPEVPIANIEAFFSAAGGYQP